MAAGKPWDFANKATPADADRFPYVQSPGAADSDDVHATWAQVKTALNGAITPASHTHTAGEISNLAEAVDDRVAALLVAGTNITLTYNDPANTLTIASTAGGGSGDDWEIVTASPTSTYQASGLTGNALIKLTLGGDTAISPPTGSTFGAGRRFFVIYELTASGSARTPSFSSHTLVGGVDPVRTIQTTDAALRIVTYTDDNGSTWNLQGDWPFAQQPAATPEANDVALFADANDANRIKQFTLLASDTNAGIAEAATIAETNTGTDAARYVTPDGLAGAYAGTKAVSFQFTVGETDSHVAGAGQASFCVPSSLSGMNLVAVTGTLRTAGTTGSELVQIRRRRSGSNANMLSTRLTFASGSTSGSSTVIDTANDDVQTGDLIYMDIDQLHTTPAQGGAVVLEFRLP